MILTDAEYGQLTDVQKIDYWRRRFYDMEEKYEEEHEARLAWQGVTRRVYDVITYANIDNPT